MLTFLWWLGIGSINFFCVLTVIFRFLLSEVYITYLIDVHFSHFFRDRTIRGGGCPRSVAYLSRSRDISHVAISSESSRGEDRNNAPQSPTYTNKG